MVKKNFKLITIIITLLTIFLSTTASLANSTLDTAESASELNYFDYLKLQREGVIGTDVTYGHLKKLAAQSRNLEKKLEESTDFYEVPNPGFRINSHGLSIQSGDVLVTNGTSSFGILGHAGIAISGTQILHIQGPKHKPSVINRTEWHNLYGGGWTKVYRNTNYSNAVKARDWAVNTYRGSNATYKITMNLASTNETYCSKLVWQAYYYGVGKSHANGPTWGYRLPYDLPTTIKNLKEVK